VQPAHHIDSTRGTVRRRVAYGALGLLALAAAIGEMARHGTGWWQFLAFGAGPDAALLLGVGRGLARGQLHPRAVRAYNLVHGLWGPAGLAALAILVLPAGYLVGALAWTTHVALDRSLGYGLRSRDGFQRR
jgi:hypothetical protein